MKVVWTKEERATVQNALVAWFSTAPYSDRKEALRQAQAALPHDRRRKITDQVVFAMKDKIHEAQERGVAYHEELKKMPRVTVEPEIQVRPSIGALFEDLVVAIAEAVLEKIEGRFTAGATATPEHNAAMARANSVLREAMNSAAASLHPNKQRWLIVGLIEPQFRVVDQQLRKIREIELKYLTAEEAKNRPALDADHVVLMTKFINHAVQDKYRSTRARVHYCNGGTSAACDMVLNHVYDRKITN